MPIAEPLDSCPLCSESSRVTPFRQLRGFEKDYLVRCQSCHFTFSLLDPTQQDYEAVYSQYDYAGEDSARTVLSVENEKETVRQLARYRSIGNVLDVAAGSGRFLEHFREAGFDCYATEFSPSMCEYLEGKGFTAYEGGLNPIGAPSSNFDVIVFTEIVEHTNKPLDALENIFRLLRSGGVVYITTPNFNSLERRIIGPGWGMLMWPEHITYWTPKTLDQALRQAGFVKSSLVTSNISPYRIVQALKRGRFARAFEGVSEQSVSDTAQAKVASSGVLSAMKTAINYALLATGLGSSIKAIYVKP